MNDKLKIYDIKWTSTTAGPSPDDNRRTELFLWGCEKAAKGNPCKNCFNSKIWKVSDAAKEFDPQEVAKNITWHAPNKYITIVGGEPLDQLEPLAKLCALLKQYGFHIILFTHYELKDIMVNLAASEHPNAYYQLLSNIDMLIDGEYDETQRIYDDTCGDGLHDAVGSANQVIWDFEDWRRNSNGGLKEYGILGMKAGDLAGIYVCPNDELRYITKDDNAEWVRLEAAA